LISEVHNNNWQVGCLKSFLSLRDARRFKFRHIAPDSRRVGQNDGPAVKGCFPCDNVSSCSGLIKHDGTLITK
jgi:hypothetical protein